MVRRAALFFIGWAIGAIWTAQAQPVRLSLPAWIETGNDGIAPKFEATLNGKPAGISSQLGPTSDQVILIVLDFTGDPSLVDTARQALVTEICKLPRNAWVGLLRSQDGLHVIADPGSDRHPVLEGIQSSPTSGNPGLLETVPSALSLADSLIRKAPVRVSVLYMTDSNISQYREDFTNPVINQSDPHDLSRRFPEALIEEKISKLIDAAGLLQAPLFIVHLHDRGDRLNRAYENGLQTLADATGGRADLCRSVAEIPEAISRAFERIASSWRLILNVPPQVHGTAQVSLTGSSRGEELKLSWRSRLEAKGRETDADGARANRSRAGL